MNDDTLARCNWCDRPMIFHPLRKRVQHGLLCWLAFHPTSYIPIPILVFSRERNPMTSAPVTSQAPYEVTFSDLFMLSLCLYREDRGGGTNGMVAVACAVRNRVLRDKSSYYAEVVKRFQFSSITVKGDPELTLYAPETDPVWVQAKSIATQICAGAIADPTGGATLYYAASIPFPVDWNRAKVKPTVSLGGQHFFVETA